MRKALFIVVMLVLVIVYVRVTAQSKDNVPLLIRTFADSKLDRLDIVTPCVKDTIRISISVSVRFDENFSDMVELDSSKESYVLGFSYVDKDVARKSLPISYDEIVFEDFEYSESDFSCLEEIIPKQETPQDRCIREFCDAKFKVWLQRQPYSKMYDIERFYGHNGFVLTYPVFLIPKHIVKCEN